MAGSDYVLSVIITISVLLLIIVLMWRSARANSANNLKCIDKALDELDCVVDGLRLIGKTSKVIAWRRVDDPKETTPIMISQLCRTAGGRFFEHIFEIRLGEMIGGSASLISEERAKSWLSHDVEAYESTFGKLDIA